MNFSYNMLVCTSALVLFSIYKNSYTKKQKVSNRIIKKCTIKVPPFSIHKIDINSTYWIFPVSGYSTDMNFYGLKSSVHGIVVFNESCPCIFNQNMSVEIINIFSQKEQIFECFYVERLPFSSSNTFIKSNP